MKRDGLRCTMTARTELTETRSGKVLGNVCGNHSAAITERAQRLGWQLSVRFFTQNAYTDEAVKDK